MKNNCLNHIDLRESIIIKIEFSTDQKLIIVIKSDKNVLIEIEFDETIEFICNLHSKIAYIKEINKETDFLKEALKREYLVSNPIHYFREFQLIDINNFPVIKIISKKIDYLIK